MGELPAAVGQPPWPITTQIISSPYTARRNLAYSSFGNSFTQLQKHASFAACSMQTPTDTRPPRCCQHITHHSRPAARHICTYDWPYATPRINGRSVRGEPLPLPECPACIRPAYVLSSLGGSRQPRPTHRSGPWRRHNMSAFKRPILIVVVSLVSCMHCNDGLPDNDGWPSNQPAVFGTALHVLLSLKGVNRGLVNIGRRLPGLAVPGKHG